MPSLSSPALGEKWRSTVRRLRVALSFFFSFFLAHVPWEVSETRGPWRLGPSLFPSFSSTSSLLQYCFLYYTDVAGDQTEASKATKAAVMVVVVQAIEVRSSLFEGVKRVCVSGSVAVLKLGLARSCLVTFQEQLLLLLLRNYYSHFHLSLCWKWCLLRSPILFPLELKVPCAKECPRNCKRQDLSV